MRIMLDTTAHEIHALSEKYNFDFWQLRTPLTRRSLAGVPYGLDNGCFKRFHKKTWLRLVDEAHDNPPVFVCLPDMVGDAVRTLDLFDAFDRQLNGLPKALVLQDGIGRQRIPWDRIDAVFVGGTDNFKISKEAINACRTAKMLDKWVHVGRVNTPERVRNWVGLADSIDGSGISQYTHMLEAILDAVRGEIKQVDWVA